MGDRERLLALARDHYGRVAWTHKTHEKERELSSTRVSRTNWWVVGLTSATFVLVAAGSLLAEPITLAVGAVFGALSAGLSIYQASANPARVEAAHHAAAKEFLSLRNRLGLVIERCMAEDGNVSQLRGLLEQIVTEINLICQHAPATSPEAYAAATGGLKTNEELTFTDGEIDSLLPPPLRLSGEARAGDESVQTGAA